MADKPGVLVAMSGGVDSSVAAALLQRAGYDVTGVFMCLGQAQNPDRPHPGCCSPQDARDAKEVAALLGVRFHVLDFRNELEEIIDYFVDEYRHGRTPNPCIMCNTRLKFGKLIEYADMIGADYVATGHYGRIETIGGQKRLCRGVDNSKDQSYALFGIGRDKLSRILLPLGEHSKGHVRTLAGQMNLSVHDKGESQEICFVADDDYARLVAERAPELCRAGEVVDTTGKVLGKHQGVYRYTIGQRRGLGIAMGAPAYVISLDEASNTVVLGSREELMSRRLWAGKLNWLVDPIPTETFWATVQIRYNHRGAPGKVTPIVSDQGIYDRAVVDFDQPVTAVTPGQAVVFYDDQIVLGGGWIEKSD